ncbi:aspartate/glutamate racemase family protein [Desulfobaculum sp. SPO524]|uniref:aspartate/glutamate racemase family protein n=1 Tax=Desulfobaculum sp. SPO524 TaxID=3378071 RepID=UPI00385234C5
MRRIGLLGGMSWESTIEYYRIINEEIARRLGGVHSADIVMQSYDFQQVADLMHAGRWDDVAAKLTATAESLIAAGAECMLICTNTVHNIAPKLESAISVPLLHIADAAGRECTARGWSRVGLLGTAFTMEYDFYRGRLADAHGVEVCVPGEAERKEINRIIFEELVKGELRDDSRATYLEAISRLKDNGAQAVVLGCTEIPLLVGPEHTDVPLLDTTRLHALAAVEFALAGEGAAS